MKKIKFDGKCYVCKKKVIWGKTGCPHITEKDYESYGFSIAMGNLPVDAKWICYKCNKERR